MTAGTPGLGTAQDAARHAAAASDLDRLRVLAVAAGIACAILFVAIGLGYGLQMYADGSIFSYAVAVQDGWAFHWHDLSGRLTVYLYALAPAEAYVALTKDARGGIVLYGFLFFAAQALGLAATFAADRSRRRIVFNYACGSTALLCPLVFGFPTETWIAHALFWPALTVCHYAGGGIGGLALAFAALLALVLSHEGALLLAAAIVAMLLLRGKRDAALVRGAGAFLAALAVWIAVKAAFPPGEYFAGVFRAAALNVFTVANLAGDLVLLLIATLAAYALAFLVLRRSAPAKAHIYAAAVVAVGLAIYWLRFDQALHTYHRYFLRTIVLLGAPALGMLAAIHALDADGRLRPGPLLARAMRMLADGAVSRAAAGAFALAMLVHAVETAKFVAVWTDYKAAVRSLATGMASDPALGDARFVSSQRIAAGPNRLSWSSTTLYLSVLMAPNFAPARLVVDPKSNYFWLTCETATASLAADRVVPAESRRLLRIYECLHR